MPTPPDTNEGRRDEQPKPESSPKGQSSIREGYKRTKTRIGKVATSFRQTLQGLPRDAIGPQLEEFGRLQSQLDELNNVGETQLLEDQPSPESATAEQIERATQGAGEFKDLLATVRGRETREELRDSDFGIKLQAMYMGLKPATFLYAKERAAVRDISLPPRFKIFEAPGGGDTLLFDENLVRDAIQRFPNDFSDIGDEQSVEGYLQSTFPEGRLANDAHGSGRTVQIGLLLGFPEDAVRRYAANFDILQKGLPALDKSIADTRAVVESIGEPTNMNSQALEALDTVVCREKRNPEAYDKARQIINENRPYILSYVKDSLDQGGIAATDEQIVYLVDREGVTGYGFDWSGMAQDRHFLPRVAELFAKSGMSAIAGPSKQRVRNVGDTLGSKTLTPQPEKSEQM